jgi:hypothetical protein
VRVRLGSLKKHYFIVNFEVIFDRCQVRYITGKVYIFSYTGCRKINVFQVEGLVGKNLGNLEKIK